MVQLHKPLRLNVHEEESLLEYYTYLMDKDLKDPEMLHECMRLVGR